MSECMTQEDAAKMNNKQAVEILKPLRDMMIDQNGCPVSDAVFALDKAIKALTAQKEVIPCCKCLYWDRNTLRHNFNDFRDWNEAWCKKSERLDPYHEFDWFTEAEDFCSYAERKADD